MLALLALTTGSQASAQATIDQNKALAGDVTGIARNGSVQGFNIGVLLEGATAKSQATFYVTGIIEIATRSNRVSNNKVDLSGNLAF